MVIEYDYSMLKGLIREKNLTQLEVAELIGLSETTFSLKINNKSEFKQGEIERIVMLLDIPPEKIGTYFFTHVV